MIYKQQGNIEQIVDQCVKFYHTKINKVNKEKIKTKRKQISYHIKKFHAESGTLNPEIKESIDVLRSKFPLVLMTAHQPNLFPYSGVLRKATLNYVLQEKLKKRLNHSVVSIFGIADQDFTDDRWVKSSLLPAIRRKRGVKSIQIDLPDSIILKNIPKPADSTIRRWRKELERWYQDTISYVKDHLNTQALENFNQLDESRDRFEEILGIVDEALDGAECYSDFNAFFTSKIVNHVWGYDTLFTRFSDCQKIFLDDFNFLLSNFNTYSSDLKESTICLPAQKDSSGVSEKEYEYIPFWYHCDCGSKVRLKPVIREDSFIARGKCIRCHKELVLDLGEPEDPDISSIVSDISARAISMILVFSRGLLLTCYCGGVGGIDYLKQAKHVTEEMGITYPITVVWRPHDVYLGISQLEAILEYKRITGHNDLSKLDEEINKLENRIKEIYSNIYRLEKEKEKKIEELKKTSSEKPFYELEEFKKILEEINELKKSSRISVLNHDLIKLKNLPRTLDLIPSIIDHAVNIGLEETSKQWINYLDSNKPLDSNLYMDSFLDDLENYRQILACYHSEK